MRIAVSLYGIFSFYIDYLSLIFSSLLKNTQKINVRLQGTYRAIDINKNTLISLTKL